MNKWVDFIIRRRACSAIALAFMASILALLQGGPQFHNDEVQMYFMLLNGGDVDGPLGYAVYPNFVLGWCIAQLSIILPSVNVYLLFLYVLSFLACCSANFFVLATQMKGGKPEGRYQKAFALASCLLMLSINFMCMKNMSYTHVAVWSGVCGALILGSAEENGAWRMRVLVGALLLIGAYALRGSALVPAFFVACVSLWRHRRHKKILIACSGIGLFIGVLALANVLAYSAHPEWETARRCNLDIRVPIVDSPDNSGVDKTNALEAKGIHPHSFASFKSFIYSPSLSHEETMKEALAIHREARRGLWGSSLLARFGFLEDPWGACLKGDKTFYRAIEPWIPLMAACFLWLLGAQRCTMGAALRMWGALACYLGALFFFHRMVGRVVDPFLYGAAIWMLGLPPKNHAFAAHKLTCAVSVCVALLAALFTKRHWPELMDAANGGPYFAAHPDTLYLTTVQQANEIYPSGFWGCSYRWMSQSNVIPIADGWVYYSPAYASALRRCGFTTLDAAFMHPRTRLVVRKRNKEIIPHLEKWAAIELGKKVELSVVDSYGGLYVVKVEEK